MNAKVTNKNSIILWDSERVGNHVDFHYVTSLMSEDHPCVKVRVFADDLEQFVIDNELNMHQTDVDDFKSYDAWDYLMDCWGEVKDKYWDEFLHPKLEQSFNEAMAYVQSHIDKAGEPLSADQLKGLYKKVKFNYGVELGEIA